MEIGTVLSLPGAALAELAGGALDFAWIDLEHGALGLGDMQAMTVGLAAAGCAAHVRLPASRAECLAAVLDAGVDGIVAPRVESVAEACDLVRRLQYPPAGRRGFGPRRAGRYGRSTPEGRPTCTVQIETRAGLAAAAEIAAVDGVDALAVGCSDLSFELDVPQDLAASSLRAAVEDIAAAAASAGARFGVAASGDPASVAVLAAGRADFLVYSADTRIYSRAVDAALRSLEAHHA
ncbi:MAG TPA: aldolase/citrate lyase family protein [Solirubrobacteraceae bacterium]|nr:aldolase/citrate lyase family protein [Solirubrobacteraceae bacterium]